MAFDQYFVHDWKSIPPVASTDSGKSQASACFDCSICLDFARDPVVTLCGHLYCWPCIYKWFQSASVDSDEQLPKCPICKAEISDKTMVPLYGRGQCLSGTEHEGKNIPPRPSARGIQSLSYLSNPGQQLASRDPYQNLQNFPYSHVSNGGDSSSPLHNLQQGVELDISNSRIGMFGEMVYARVFGNSQSLYTYPNSYHLEGRSTPRLRRQELQANRSLNRISIFLFCCFILCLLLF